MQSGLAHPHAESVLVDDLEHLGRSRSLKSRLWRVEKAV